MSGNEWLLLLNDGRAGHWRQVSALACLLQQRTGATDGRGERLGARCVELPVRLHQPWRALAPRSLPFGRAAHAAMFRALPSPAPRAVISCGRRTALVLRWLKRFWTEPPVTVQILHCGIHPRHFDWLITPRHDGICGPNVICIRGSLHPVDDAWLAAAPPLFSTLPEPRVVLLLGGPGRKFPVSHNWFRERLAGIAAVVVSVGGSLVAVASKRTPQWAAAEAQAVARDPPGRFIPWRDELDRSEAYRAALAGATHLVVTADSVNMLSEAAATGKPVFVLGADRVRGRVAGFVRGLVEDGYALDAAWLRAGLAGDSRTRILRETAAVAARLRRSGNPG